MRSSSAQKFDAEIVRLLS